MSHPVKHAFYDAETCVLIGWGYMHPDTIPGCVGVPVPHEFRLTPLHYRCVYTGPEGARFEEIPEPPPPTRWRKVCRSFARLISRQR